ncbi:aflatoxin biosynthesis ketoreductase nor-1 [Verticillium alfalfae VaMs.102]|uniref:Aflatoxin biosynthesis ketoreductase nor-1 n=1 Tax=Verticillium alfalfae (strain VaMs.102 / ATCC MYA-4576 / FGSC 10136) TaxID=526221 RepID=C9SK32_VERA1|nr:aflatoxin biosynthesis ketoreductase nor-1 [Verticillium alfalfae VaMs.102]EEY19050.1 aflatoxin biosynthesis ketoreductase nor-1 [Verticillium alfalfae VaMs.102]
MSTTYLITGTTRGIGHAIVRALLLRPSTTVIAGVRDPAHAAAQALTLLPRCDSSRLVVLALDAADLAAPFQAVATLQSEHGIKVLDVVIANAAAGESGNTILQTDLESVGHHVAINTTAPLALLQATAPLLRKSANPKFIGIGSELGSVARIEGMVASPWPRTTSPYGLTKAALNWVVRTAHFEEPWLTAVVVTPGLVKTDMAAVAVKDSGIGLDALGAITTEESAEGVLKAVDRASRDGPGFLKYDGGEVPW